MTWCNNNSVDQLVTTLATTNKESNDTCSSSAVVVAKTDEVRTSITCPSCGHNIELQDQGTSGGINDLPGLPAGVKFDPTDTEILEHLEAKVFSDMRKLHPLIDEFIPTLEGENGICYTHPEKLPGVSKDGQIRHFFHRPSKAYTTGTRKRRKVHTDEDGSETRWHKTGKTRPVNIGGTVKGFKKILVLYTNYGRQRKPEKTNWVMHQYHLGNNEEEKDRELVLSKVFYQTQPRQSAITNLKDSMDQNLIRTSQYNQNNPLSKNSSAVGAGYVEYYNNQAFISYDHHQGISHVHNRESSPQIIPIPNLVVQGDGSSYFRLAAETSKRKLQNRDG